LRSYSDVAAFLARVENARERKMNERTPLSSDEIAEVLARFPGVPRDYIDYMREIGWGSFRECQFMVYGDLATPNDMIGEEAAACYGDSREEVLCFGDDFSGDMSGFLPKQGWAVVELRHDSGSLRRMGKPFGQYIREQMLMGPRGEDLRA
jgi:hypothetical protein